MCGPLALAVPGLRDRSTILSRAIYNGGRVLTYTLLGAVAGLIGRPLNTSVLQEHISIVLGLAVLALALTGLHAWKAPVGVVRVVQRLKQLFARQLHKNGLGALFVLGVLNGLLPCGLVYLSLWPARF